jgi:chromosome segregation ATPase
MKHILLFLLLFVSATAFAETEAQDELNRLEAELSGVRQEQQSVYQNYQMTKELRLTEVQESSPSYGESINTPPPNYDDVMREQLEREQRIQQYSDELKSLSERYLDLEEERKALLEQIRELKQQTQ